MDDLHRRAKLYEDFDCGYFSISTGKIADVPSGDQFELFGSRVVRWLICHSDVH